MLLSPDVYQLEYEGGFFTFKSMDKLASLRRLFPEKLKKVRWVVAGNTTIFNDEFKVTKTDIPLDWVEWL